MNDAATSTAISFDGNGHEYPDAVIDKIVNGGGKLTKRDVAAVLGDFKMSVSIADVEEKAFAIVVRDESDLDAMKSARDLRMQLRNERIRIDKARVIVKEPHLRRIQVIDGVGKYLRDLFDRCESYLESQENFKKIRDAERRQKRIDDRTAALSPFVESIEPYRSTLADITDEAFSELLNNSIEAKRSREEAAQRAEKERQEREQKLREENERLRAERDAAEVKAKSEAEAARQADLERQKAETELHEKEAFEAAERLRLEDEKRKAAAAPDRDKIVAFLQAISDLPKPVLSTPEAKALFERFFDAYSTLVNETEKLAFELKAECPF